MINKIEIHSKKEILFSIINNNKRNFVILLFLISPLLSLPFIFIEIYNKKRYAQSLLAIFMGFAAFLYPPLGDLYRHTKAYFDFIIYPEKLGLTIEQKGDFLLYIISYLFGYLGIKFEFVRFIFITISYEIIFWIFRDIIKRRNELKNNYFKIFLIFYFCLPFIYLTSGLRQWEGNCLFVLGIYLLCNKRKIGLIPLLLSVCLHISFIIYIFIFLPIVIFKYKITNRISIILIGLIIIFLNPLTINLLLDLLSLPDILKRMILLYIEGKWNGEVFEENNFKFKMLLQFKIAMVYPFLFLPFLLQNNLYTGIARLCIPIFIFGLMFSYSIYDRFAEIIFLLGFSSFILYYKKIKSIFFKRIIKLVLFLTILSFSSQIYRQQRTLSLSREYYLACPAPIIFLNHYDKIWIYNNVEKRGFT